MKIRKILAITLAAVMALSMSAFAAEEQAAEPAESEEFTWNGNKEVWAILPTTGVPGLMMHADSMGWNMEKYGWTYVTKDAQGDPTQQVNYFEDAIAAGNVGAIMCAAMDGPMLEDVANEAKEAGIAVVYLGLKPEYKIGGFVATAYEVVGGQGVEIAQAWLEQRLAEGGNIPTNADGKYEVSCDIYLDITDGIYKSNAMVGTVNSSDNLVSVSETQSYGDSAQNDAAENAAAVLAAHPDCRIFICYEPDEAIGYNTAIMDFAEVNGLDLADFCVISCYGEDPTFHEMFDENAADETHSTNAIKGYVTYGYQATDEQQEAYDPTGANAYSPTGEQLAYELLGITGEEGFDYAWGDEFYDSVRSEDVYGHTLNWEIGDENPYEQYRVSEYQF